MSVSSPASLCDNTWPLEHDTRRDSGAQRPRIQSRPQQRLRGASQRMWEKCWPNIPWPKQMVLKTGAAEHEPLSRGPGVSSVLKERREAWGAGRRAAFNARESTADTKERQARNVILTWRSRDTRKQQKNECFAGEPLFAVTWRQNNVSPCKWVDVICKLQYSEGRSLGCKMPSLCVGQLSMCTADGPPDDSNFNWATVAERRTRPDCHVTAALHTVGLCHCAAENWGSRHHESLIIDAVLRFSVFAFKTAVFVFKFQTLCQEECTPL